MIRQAIRAAVILWTFTRRGLLWSVYRDVVRRRLEEVCICRPSKTGVLDRLNSDLALLERLRWFVGRVRGVSRNMPVGEFLLEFRRGLLEQVNLEYEAINIERFRDNHPDDGPARAPAVY